MQNLFNYAYNSKSVATSPSHPSNGVFSPMKTSQTQTLFCKKWVTLQVLSGAFYSAVWEKPSLQNSHKWITIWPHLSGKSSAAVPYQWGTSDAVSFGTHSSDYWRWVTESSGTNSSVLLMIPGRRFFMINTVVTTQFLDLFSLTLIHGAMVCHAAMSASTVHGADLPNHLCHCLCPFSGPSLSYFTENWVGNILIHKLFSDHIPSSLSLQCPLLSCAILSYQNGCISSLTVITWARPHSTLQVHQACGAEGAKICHGACLSFHRSPMKVCSEACGQKSFSVTVNVPSYQNRECHRTSDHILIHWALC